MSSDKRDFVDFSKFPGTIKADLNLYQFPPLYHNDDMGRKRSWTINVRLVKDGARQTALDWNLLEENEVKLKDEYLKTGADYTDLPEYTIAEAWAESGIEGMKITRNIPTYFDKCANKGKANQRNPLHQALIWARAQYLKRQEKGGTEAEHGSKKAKSLNVKYFPMLARPYKDGIKYIKYPIFVQRKYDGIRCLTYFDIKSKEIVMYSRAQKDFPGYKYLKDILIKYLPDFVGEKCSLYLDGELYKHGLHLQDISGESRNESKNQEGILEYHIYDCFYPDKLDMPFKERLALLERFHSGITSSDTKFICPVETFECKDRDCVDKIFNKVVKEGYEGCILRNEDGPYRASATKTSTVNRSHDLVKMKKKFTDEYEVVDFTEGKKGKDKGAIIWICLTNKKPGSDEKTKKAPTKKVAVKTARTKFKVTPKDINYEGRYKLFKECSTDDNFNKKYKGLMLSVEYEELSKTGVPQRAKALTFRNYE